MFCFILFVLWLWDFLLPNIGRLNHMFISLILKCDFSSYLTAVLFVKNVSIMCSQSYWFSKAVV